jgi:hypothetical protein
VLALVVLALVVAAGVIGYYCGRPTPLPELRDPHQLVVRDLDPPLNEPWMTTHESAVVIPVAALLVITRPDDLQTARRGGRPLHLAGLVHVAGLERPLDVRFDRLGRVVLADGHNRVVMAEITGRLTLPVTFSTIAQIKSYAVPAENFFGALCRATTELGSASRTGPPARSPS